MHRVSALFCRSDSVYRDLLFDVWDAERDARNYAGPWPVVAHPPCRGWGSMRNFAKPRRDELELAFYAVDAVRRWGGVLEHPFASRLWPVAGLPVPGEVDAYGGWSITVDQGWWGHYAPKPTRLYVVGMPRHHCPQLPVDEMRRRTGRTLDMLQADRERTPWLFADWLVRLAARCYVPPGAAVTHPTMKAAVHSIAVFEGGPRRGERESSRGRAKPGWGCNPRGRPNAPLVSPRSPLVSLVIGAQAGEVPECRNAVVPKDTKDMQDTQDTERSPSQYSSWRSAVVPKDTEDTQRSWFAKGTAE